MQNTLLTQIHLAAPQTEAVKHEEAVHTAGHHKVSGTDVLVDMDVVFHQVYSISDTHCVDDHVPVTLQTHTSTYLKVYHHQTTGENSADPLKSGLID